jgi:hypothetical protein
MIIKERNCKKCPTFVCKKEKKKFQQTKEVKAIKFFLAKANKLSEKKLANKVRHNSI